MQRFLLVPSTFSLLILLGCKSSTCPKGYEENLDQVCIPISVEEEEVVEVEEVVVEEVKRITTGEYSLFSDDKEIDNKENGIKAFEDQKYPDAINYFNKWRKEDPQNPEALIFYNNALALQQENNPYTLAVVVPVNSKSNSAKEILRGVAQAQNKFNTDKGINNRLLKIVIANDGNERTEAKKIAEALIKDTSILGVIGHNSSSATEAALEVYKQANLAIISPTSTSTTLSDKVFFRTVPSDKQTGEKLAQYIRNNLNLSRVIVFYNSKADSSYSNSLKEAFRQEFVDDLGGNVLAKDFRELKPNIASGYLALINNNSTIDAAVLFPGADYTSMAIDIAKANFQLPEENRILLFGGDSLYSGETLTGGNESVENMILAAPWFTLSPQSQNFSQLAETLWKGGKVNWRTAMSFDATQAFINTFSEDSSPSNTINKLKNVKLSTEQTSGGIVEFTPEGERNKVEPILVKISEGGVRPPDSEFGYHLIE